jgi:hypothetical protein
LSSASVSFVEFVHALRQCVTLLLLELPLSHLCTIWIDTLQMLDGGAVGTR